ncbi:PepSY domain-containing protein [Candidatus Margulisiibacteriota bacterium]
MKKVTVITLLAILLVGITAYSIYAAPRYGSGRWFNHPMRAGYGPEYCPGPAYLSGRNTGFSARNTTAEKPISKSQALSNAQELISWRYGADTKIGKVKELESVFEIEIKNKTDNKIDHIIVDKYSGRIR